MCRALTDARVSATSYHAGMTPSRRSQALADWQSGTCQVGLGPSAAHACAWCSAVLVLVLAGRPAAYTGE